MKKIKLTGKNGMHKCALVDDEDFEELNQYKWYLSKSGYAKRKNIWMHRIIFLIPIEMQVDHINGDKLDNRKANLRQCIEKFNHQNVKKHFDGKSLYKGICWDKQMKKWRVKVCFNYQQILIGLFDNERHAAMAYDLNAKALFGEFAKLNF